MVKYSIIIPTYNNENYILKCVNSLLNQTYDNFQIIIVNDGSTDHTTEILQEVNDKRIIIINQKNSGLASARNVGIERSCGQYIIFVDSDDYVEDNLLFNVDKFCDGITDIIVFGIKVNYINHNKIEMLESKVNLYGDEAIKATISCGLFNFAWNKLYRREFLINQPRFEKKMPMEDILFNINVFNKTNKVVLINESFYVYNRYGSESLVSKYYEKLNELYSELIPKISILIDELNDEYLYEWLKKEKIQYYHVMLINLFRLNRLTCEQKKERIEELFIMIEKDVVKFRYATKSIDWLFIFLLKMNSSKTIIYVYELLFSIKRRIA